jgi:hypothetical protein
MKLMAVISQDFMVYLFFLQNNALEHLSQIVEEAIIFAYEDAIQGMASCHEPLLKFLQMSLDFIELAISKHY